jgi:hypothetical protein
MDASVTLKVSPQEFDLIRSSIEWDQSNAERTARDRDTDAKLRDEARKRAFLLAELLKKLK